MFFIYTLISSPLFMNLSGFELNVTTVKMLSLWNASTGAEHIGIWDGVNLTGFPDEFFPSATISFLDDESARWLVNHPIYGALNGPGSEMGSMIEWEVQESSQCRVVDGRQLCFVPAPALGELLRGSALAVPQFVPIHPQYFGFVDGTSDAYARDVADPQKLVAEPRDFGSWHDNVHTILAQFKHEREMERLQRALDALERSNSQ